MSAYRIFVSSYFAFGVAWSALVLAAMVYVRRRFDRSTNSGAAAPTQPSLVGATAFAGLVFGIALASRVSIVDRIFDPGFLYVVEAMDSCIAPFQQKLGLRLWGANLMTHATNAVVSSFAIASHEIFGFAPHVLRLLHALAFSLGVAFFAQALLRAFGIRVAMVVAGILLASFPFVLHSVWATGMGAAALPALLYFGLLLPAAKVSRTVALATGALLGASLLVYPGATIAMGCFFALQLVLQRERWSVVALGLFGAGAAASKWILDRIYETPFTRIPDAGGSLTLQYVGEALRVTPQDFFFRSTSFASLNFGGPYFEPLLFWALALALVRPTRVFALCLGVFAANLVLSALTGPYPGARRVLWSLPLLYLGCVHAVFRSVEGSRRAAAVQAAFALSLGLVCARDVVLAQRHFPIFPPDRFYAEAASFLRKHAPLDAEVALLEDGMFGAKHHWCALGFTKELWHPERVPLLLPKGKAHSSDAGEEYWLLLHPEDDVADVRRVFAHADLDLIHRTRPSPADRGRSPLRVVRVKPRGTVSRTPRTRPSRAWRSDQVVLRRRPLPGRGEIALVADS